MYLSRSLVLSCPSWMEMTLHEFSSNHEVMDSLMDLMDVVILSLTRLSIMNKVYDKCMISI